MNPARSRRRWWLFTLLILAGQVGLIFWLSDYSTPAVRRATPGPSLHLASQTASELFALTDPTLFALPHAKSFSGKAWLATPTIPDRSFEWSADLEWLPLPVSRLGQGLAKFLQTNRVETLNMLAVPEPELVQTQLASASVFPQKSSVRIEGPLRNRRLITPIEPRSFTNTDLLTNTIVELLVGEDGRTVSCKPLPPGSGSREVDQEAVTLARSAWFESLVRNGPHRPTNSTPLANIMWGTMVFSWHTLPTTNAAAAKP